MWLNCVVCPAPHGSNPNKCHMVDYPEVSHAIFNTRTNQKTLVKKTVSKATGHIQVTGIRSALRASASYPSDFGFALAALLTPQGCPSTSLDRVGSNCRFHMLSCFTRIKLIGELVRVFPCQAGPDRGPHCGANRSQ